MHNPGLAAAATAGINARHTIPVAVLSVGLLLVIFSAGSRAPFAVFFPPSALIT
jgi:hypothetical protein